MSEYKFIQDNSENLLICFGGMKLSVGNILPFEFLNYLKKINLKNTNYYFFIDKNQCWYHSGINGITNNIDETVIYINNIIKKNKYKKVVFMGVSSGGYASILFGSLCNIDTVIAFIPRTTYNDKMEDQRYFDLKEIINEKTKYILYGNTKIKKKNKNSHHHISECENLSLFKNVEIIYNNGCNMKELRDKGVIKKILDNVLININ